jgi:hypothetical protein
MMHLVSARWCGAMLAFSLLWGVMSGSAIGAQISERAGAFQACLDARFQKWANERAELVVNDDPKAGDIDDAAAAKWTAEALDGCRAQVGGTDRDLEQRFVKHMSRWREHVYELVRSIRERARPD